MLKSFLTLLLMTVFFTVTAQSSSLRIMTYNIRLDHPSDSVNQWPKRAHKVYALLHKYDADIVGVQEALPNQMEDLVKNLPQYGYIGVGRDDGKSKGEFSAILFKKNRLRVSRNGSFWLSETPEIAGSKSWDAAITRVATWGEFEDLVSGDCFLAINTHFDHIGKTARDKSAALLKEKAAVLRKKLPVVVTGDFNSQPTEAPYTTTIGDTPFALIDTRPVSETQGTFCSFKVGSIPCRTIDYIFYAGPWSVQSYKVITDNDGTYYPSDHLPVMSELRLK